jgi:hypothetical protein
MIWMSIARDSNRFEHVQEFCASASTFAKSGRPSTYGSEGLARISSQVHTKKSPKPVSFQYRKGTTSPTRNFSFLTPPATEGGDVRMQRRGGDSSQTGAILAEFTRNSWGNRVRFL